MEKGERRQLVLITRMSQIVQLGLSSNPKRVFGMWHVELDRIELVWSPVFRFNELMSGF